MNSAPVCNRTVWCLALRVPFDAFLVRCTVCMYPHNIREVYYDFTFAFSHSRSRDDVDYTVYASWVYTAHRLIINCNVLQIWIHVRIYLLLHVTKWKIVVIWNGGVYDLFVCSQFFLFVRWASAFAGSLADWVRSEKKRRTSKHRF